ncbi:MAG: hypothetical protein GY845_03145 [Planctomycetes bacterium]|nr:hypothetical protein [Planctomycetota bacterium]
MIKTALIVITGSLFTGAILAQVFPTIGFVLGVQAFIFGYCCVTGEDQPRF